MKAKVSWVEGMKFVGESESGHQVTLDGANPGEGASPMEMILLAVGGCSSIDVVSILEKARQSVTACHVELEGQRVESVPRVFEKIHLNFVVTGKGLAEKQVARAVDLAEAISALPRLKLRGLMAIPEPTDDRAEQDAAFAAVQKLQASLDLPLDTLSMGMSHDLESAIAQGATWVRIGTALFGARDYGQP